MEDPNEEEGAADITADTFPGCDDDDDIYCQLSSLC